MKKTLKISKEISLPADAVTQTIGVIGRKGAGKTYLASVIVEHMLDIKAQVVVVDPVGVWWGLRISADGKTKGKEIFVIGGDHGDVPLVPEAGRRIAQLIVEKGVSAVLDVSSFGIGERKRFCADFGEEFFQLKKKKRSPVMLALEEAQLVVPQNIRPEEGRMYSAFEQIVRLGRNYGIGTMLITQRPQSVNKEVLSQVECLCVLQITGPHERKAIEAWVEEAGADRKLVGELPGLQRGEGYVWSPQWLRIYERVHFATKQTFDASATPEVGKKTRAASLSAVDVASLKQDIADVVEQAEKDDPIKLHKKIKELETLLKKPAAAAATPVDTKVIERAVKDAERRKDIEFMAERDEFIKHINTFFKVIETVGKAVKDIKMPDLKKRAALTKENKQTFYGIPVHVSPKVALKLEQSAPQSNEQGTSGTPLSGSPLRLLQALASNYPNELTRSQAATMSTIKPTSSTFRNAISILKGMGYLEIRGNSLIATYVGSINAGDVQNAPKTPEEVRARWRSILAAGPIKMLDYLIGLDGQPTTRGELAAACELDPGISTFRNYLSILRSNGLVEVNGDQIKASTTLF
jgi:hypothetical protein